MRVHVLRTCNIHAGDTASDPSRHYTVIRLHLCDQTQTPSRAIRFEGRTLALILGISAPNPDLPEQGLAGLHLGNRISEQFQSI